MPHDPFVGGVAFFGGSFDPPHLGHLAVARAAQSALALDRVLFAPVGRQPLKIQAGAFPSASFEHRVAMTRLAIASDPAFELSLADAPKPSSHPNSTPNYTIDTLLALRAQASANSTANEPHPAASQPQLFCLMGADSFQSLRQWHRAAEIPFAATLVVAARPGYSLADLSADLPPGLTLSAIPSSRQNPDSSPDRTCARDPSPWETPWQADAPRLLRFDLRDPAGNHADLYLLPGLHVDINASQIRAQIRKQISGYLPEQLDPAASYPAIQRLLPPPVADYIVQHSLYLPQNSLYPTQS